MKTKFILPIIFSFFFLAGTQLLYAQNNPDSVRNSDVIIRTDGEIVYGKVKEVNSDNIKYIKNDVLDGPLVTLPRKLVYAISYSNNTFQVITPVFGKKKTSLKAYDQTEADALAQDSLQESFKENLKYGSLKIGLGFSREYSTIKNVDDFEKSSSSPSIFVAYYFRLNRLFKIGVSLGYASFNYDYDYFSDYDQINISQDITENVFSIGVFGRYDLMDRFVRPYLLGGLNFNHSDVDLDGEVFFEDEQKRVEINSGSRGFKVDLVLRAGVDVNLSSRFGVYGDIGTGLSLVQLGVIFDFK